MAVTAKDIEYAENVQKLMLNQKNIRNIGIVAHIHHGKTTLTDNLAAEAGMMSKELVGERMLTWIDKQEHERLMTIYGATVTMGHTCEGEEYLINLLDTPGHVDFGADVTQALRAVDGAVVMACAVEGMMPQTETVLHQALTERVKPILFINKVDRAIKELKLTPAQLQKRLTDLVIEINSFIARNVEPEFKEQWMLSVEKGTVAFGSALKKWAISIPAMKKFNVTFKDIIDLCSQDRDEELAKRAPAHIVVLDMVAAHLPTPLQAQKYRIPRLWRGEYDSELGKSLLACDANGELAAGVTKIVYDQHAGMIATARIFSGKIKEGEILHLVKTDRDSKVQQLSTFIAQRRMPIKTAVAGNVVGLIGMTDVAVGETLCEAGKTIEPFESIKHIFEPVVTKAIEAKNPQDLPKLIEYLRILGMEDPTLKIKISPETGETLVSGLGELHLDAKVERKLREKGLDIVVSPPVVVYRETVTKKSGETEGKSPNRHNKVFMIVEPMKDSIYQAIKSGRIPEGKIKKKKQELIEAFCTAGMERDEAKQVVEVYNGNILVEATRGVVHIGEIMEMVHEAFEEVMEQGPLGKEPCYGLKVSIVDCKLHEDTIHRGPGQMIPCARQAITNAMLVAGTVLYEPAQTIRIDTPMEYLTEASKLVIGRRGLVIETNQQGTRYVMVAEVPVMEMFGFEAALKSASGGRGFQSLIDVAYKKLPSDLQLQTILRIRERKGMTKEMPKPIFD
ncbi:MAG TPA: elongation factor EF-2 [Nanoarchaeota archaeon]|nr:elongation factor EF-2 [Nanoarchaeota archaeon]